ncbi:MAG: CotH kinase family protein, partial [Flavobacteriales bacterium]
MFHRPFLTTFLAVVLFNYGYCQYKDHVGFAALDSIGVRYSHTPGLYDAPIDLSFDLPNGCSMKCVVGWDQATEEFPYNGPIRIAENTFISVVVSDSLSKKYTYRANYIIGRDITLPVLCLTVTPDEFFPPNGIYEGSLVKNGDKHEAIGNAFKKKPIRCFAEFFYNKRSVVSTSCWLKTFGGLTLGLTEKSLHLVADEKLGDKEFRYKFFPEKPFNEFEHLVLRTSGSDQNATRFQDICLSSLAADMNLDHMSYQPCVVYINDKYFGILNLREKINYDYLRYNHHAIKDSTFLVVSDGLGSKEYQFLMDDLVRLHNDSNYAELIDRRMDIENYMNYSIL